MPRLLEKGLEEAAKSYKAKTYEGVCDGFSSQISTGFNKRNKNRSDGTLGGGGQCGRWPQEACTNDIFLDSEERHERASYCAYACD